MNEFDLIAAIRARTDDAPGVVLGIGDDAAVLQPGDGMQIVATADNLVAGRHFDEEGPHAASPAEIGHLALAVNLSDLAAMGARPRWSLLTLTLPDADREWLDGFLDGYLALAAAHGCWLVGGNLARGPLDIAVTALGEVPHGRFATRVGAEPGDRLVVTGTLGDAAAALELEAGAGSPLRERLLKPSPRVAAGIELAEHARAMIDISDGLLADLGHLVAGTGAEIRAGALPISDALAAATVEPERRFRLQCGGGDYELLAALPAGSAVPATIGGTPLTEIGRFDDTGFVRCVDDDGNELATGKTGWDHFRTR